MFNSIARRYDLLNGLLSFGIDKYWRKKAVNSLKGKKKESILDLACGTGDLTIEALRLNPERIVGMDASEGMLEIAKQKIERRTTGNKIVLVKGSASAIPFENDQFDAVTIGFGIRNFSDLKGSLVEIRRVLKPGGCLLILEFSKPTIFPVKQLFHFYFHCVLPIIGRMISGSKGAYSYLPISVDAFPCGDTFIGLLEAAGFNNSCQQKLTFGITTVYKAYKA